LILRSSFNKPAASNALLTSPAWQVQRNCLPIRLSPSKRQPISPVPTSEAFT